MHRPTPPARYQLSELSGHLGIEFPVTDLGDERALRASGACTASGHIVVIGPLDRRPEDPDDGDVTTRGSGNPVPYAVDRCRSTFRRDVVRQACRCSNRGADQHIVSFGHDFLRRFDLGEVMH